MPSPIAAWSWPAKATDGAAHHQVLENLQDLQFALENIESSSQGFLLTGNEFYLQSFRNSVVSAEHDEATVRDLTVDNPEQGRKLPALERLTAQEVQSSEAAVSLRRANGFKAAADAVQSGPGQRIAAELQVTVREMRDEELRLLVLRNADAERRLTQIKIVLVLGTFLGLLSAAPAGWSVQRDSSRRGLAEDALFGEKERAQVTLNCIGDAVACTDILGNITFLNLVAEKMTAWSWQEAAGRPMIEGVRIMDATVTKSTRVRCRWPSGKTEPCTCRRTAFSSAATDLKFPSKTPFPPSTTVKGRPLER